MTDGPMREYDAGGASRLWWWVCFSGALHILIIVTLFLVPPSTAKRQVPTPVYTVDLVGGGGLQGELSPLPQPEARPSEPAGPPQDTPGTTETADQLPIEPEEVDEPVPEPPATEPPVAQPVERPEAGAQEPEKMAQPKVVESVPEKKPEEERPKQTAAKKELEKKPEKKSPTVKKTKRVKKPKPKKKVVKKKTRQAAKKVEKKKAERDEIARQRLREKRIQRAVAKAQERAAQRSRAAAAGRRDSPAQVARIGGAGGRGSGTGVGGGTGGGGGVVKGLEFLIYRNRMLNEIKSRWTWIGKRSDLEVTVRFGVDGDGQIFALEIVGASGDSSYDDSVVRAVKRASPLPPPPAGYLQDFSDVELTFRPRDLNG